MIRNKRTILLTQEFRFRVILKKNFDKIFTLKNFKTIFIQFSQFSLIELENLKTYLTC